MGGLPLPVNFGALAAGKQNLSLFDTQFAAVEPHIDGSVNATVGDVLMDDTSLFFTGPSVPQGTAGTWFATGTVRVQDTAGAALFTVQLWDGTTLINFSAADSTGAGTSISISISGLIVSPVANIRISVKDNTSTSGKILAGSSLTALRLL